MCGIIGIFGDFQTDGFPLETMLQTLKHRGPDDEGMFKNNAVMLGHRRLSIVDVKQGHQPLRSQDGSTHLVCNGEIYNYQQLKNRFIPTYAFNTQSDSEPLIPLYQENGTQSVKHLDGMFSFILAENGEYFAARDPIGIKPLYFGFEGERMYFASEMKTLIDYSPNIHEFPNGHYFHSREGFKPYYQLPVFDTFITDVNQAVEKIQETLRRSVKKRLMSDVAVGVFLSGGLDSSIIAALMKAYLPELHSFSVGFPDAPDLKAARMVAEHLGTIHHEYIYTEKEMEEVLPKVIYYLESFDPALIRSAIPCYFVSQLASRYVKVVLSGEGADELFAGYSYFSDYVKPAALQQESRRTLNELHNINLQRVDRMSMAHGLEARVPFLDIEFIETVLRIDPGFKLPRTFGIEKWLLRTAFEDLLPKEIVWREKMEFAQGCGSSTVFEQRAAAISDEELQKARQSNEHSVSSKEELFYYDIFKRYFDHPDATKLIGRWKGTLH